ncbi:unnamed protein product, partial [Vitis vinifera]|uniref:Uncharacterized protein n=1 Tax=Vitis vinifera TaxID=29760 RepID=D7SZV8_VITVI
MIGMVIGVIYVKITFLFYVLSGCHASTWRDLLNLNLFKKGPLFFGGLF